MALTVLQVGCSLEPVGLGEVGGAAQAIALLDDALVRAGHRSLVIAEEGSTARGTLIPIPAAAADAPRDEAARAWVRGHVRRALAWALSRHRVDVVHLHGADFEQVLPAPGVPVLATLHLAPGACSPRAFRVDRPATFLHCVSAAQRRACPAGVSLLPEVPYGIPLHEYRAARSRRGFALAMGRVDPESGFPRALEAAARARVPLLLAGRVSPGEAGARHYREAILPLLAVSDAGAPRRFLGPIGLPRRRLLLGAARCLLVPSAGPEASSLAVMEALASGTPVIGLRGGPASELVEDGETGFLVDDAREMADAIHEVDRIDPWACRRAAEERFSEARMLWGYLESYRRAIRASRCAGLLEPLFERLGTAAA